jgi:diacylglycerol kinase (ATP)
MATTKNQSFRKRVGFAVAGLSSTLKSEHSFRFHVLASALVLAALLWVRPQPLWWAVAAVTVMSVLASELINTAIERLVDHLHPEQHPEIKVVKDCAAAAVFIVSCGALVVAAALLYELTA